MTADASPDEIGRGYEALRFGAGAFWAGREVVAVDGPDATEYLQGQCSQDVAALAVGTSADALVLSPQGRIDALVRVTRRGPDDFTLDVDAGYGEPLVARLERFRLRVKVEIAPLAWRCLSLRGPGSAALAAAAPDADEGGGPTLRPVFSWGALAGVDLLGPDPQVPDGAALCVPEAWEALRIEAGIPRMGTEIDERTIAAEAGLVERCVSFSKGCYTGQELVARLDARGSRVARRLCGLALDPAAAATAADLPGAEVVAGDKVVGTVRSAAWSPGAGAVVALAYLHRSVAPPCPVAVRPAGPAKGADPLLWAAQARLLPMI